MVVIYNIMAAAWYAGTDSAGKALWGSEAEAQQFATDTDADLIAAELEDMGYEIVVEDLR